MPNAPLSAGAYGDSVARLHDVLHQQGYQLSASEVDRKFFGPATRQAIMHFQERSGLSASGVVDEATQGLLNREVAPGSLLGARPSAPPTGSGSGPSVLPPPLVAPPAGLGSPLYGVKGSLVLDHGLPPSGITVRLYHIGFAEQDVRLGEAKSDSQGKYSFSYEFPQNRMPNLQLRVLDSQGKEVTISATKFRAGMLETLNLVVPGSIQPLASEFQRLSADMDKYIGGIAKLGQAQEGSARQDLTLLNQSTNWDARLVALAATAAQQTATTGLGHDVLYALFRIGLPTDPSLLAMVPSAAVQKALTKANQAGVVSMNDQQISATTTAFRNFASQAQLALTTPGALSSFNDLLTAALPDKTQQAAFANLYFSNPSAADLWVQAANLKIAPENLDSLKLQGKFLYLTFNSAPLAQKLRQDVGSLDNLPQMVAKDYHLPDTWQKALTALAGAGGHQALHNLIPASYPGKTTADRLAAYSGDLARKVRISFPTHVVARMIETKDIPLSDKTASNVTAFLRAAAPLGYNLGRTPLNAFINSNAGRGLPAMDADSTDSLKTLHRLYQITPSTESLQAATKLKFTAARDIASYTKEEFLGKYSAAFPPGEASLVYGRAQTVSAVTFNVFTSASQLDTTPKVYALSGSSEARQSAKNAIIQQFPSMASLFGNVDYCQCEDCRSVLSPAAYFVDVLQFLNGSAPNSKGFTPLDVLIGTSDGKTIPGRRPDLGALPLTCENTNTAMPYIDIVNEILEYYIANTRLDIGYAYDTGTASTADLTAEPQHVLPQVYSGPLKQVVFPLNLPFDLWIETVRGFLNYFKSPLAQVLDTLRPADNLELFTDANSYPYYRAQILAEALGLSPSEYGILTDTDAAIRPLATNWFKLYGYKDAATAQTELSSAKNLAQALGLSYQDLTDLMTTGFLNPGLYPLIFQFKRFGINMSEAFSYTNQPGYPTFTATQKTNFENLLTAITAQYKSQNPSSTFDAKTWLTNLLPANYSKKVLILADPNSGCSFIDTTLQYADNSAASAATPLDFVKFNLFVRLWKKLGWTLDETDRALQLFFPSTLPAWIDANFDPAFSSAWKTALVYLAHLDDLNTQLTPSMGPLSLLPFWSNLPLQGENSLYAQLFLTPSVLNNDSAFDDPNGLFPTPLSDLAPSLQTFSAHQSAVQGVLGLTADEISAILTDAGVVATPTFTLTNLSICYRYSAFAKCLQLDVADMISLKEISGLNPFQGLSGTPLSNLASDVLFNQTLLFVKQVMSVQNSGFSVEDLRYLLRHDFDPVGKYQTDPNALMALVQSVANGLQQIQKQNTVPSNLMSMPESLIDQILSGLFPAPILKALFTLLTNSQTYTASQSPVVTALDPSAFAQEPELTFNYDPTTQTQSISFHGLLLDWKKKQFENLNPITNSPVLFNGLLDAIQTQAETTLLNQRIGDILGVWASLVQCEAVKSPIATVTPTPALLQLLLQTDSALNLSYDQTDQLQWLGYRGVLTDMKKATLVAVNASADLKTLLDDVQGQALPAYNQLIGTLLAMWTNVQTFTVTQSPVASGIDSNAFFTALTTAQTNGTITDPVPQIQFSYNSASQVQTLTCQGVLTDSMRGQLAALIPSLVLASLLQAARNSAVQLFQTLATNILTVTATDLDNYSKPFLGLDATKQQKQVKAELVSVFLPLLAQKLSRQLILQTLSSNLGSDPSLTEALVTDAALLADPTDPGKSLLGAFLSLGQQGVSASYFTSTDGTGTAQAGGTAATANTADKTNSSPGTTHSAHFEGFLQVSTDGPYRFFAELGNTGAAALLQLDSPDPKALLKNPIIPSTPNAVKDHDEVSQFVQLMGGALYHFTLDFSNLGANGASLFIQGENLPKGPLSQIILYPEQAITAFTRAKVLLSKVLQILQGTSLDERETSYLIAKSSQFSNLRLSSLPTQPQDDTLTKAMALFSQFLTLADYADLRKGPAGGTDGLIDVFENVAEVFTEPTTSPDANNDPTSPWTSLANLTRRDAATVRAVGEYFKLITDQVVAGKNQVKAVDDFGNNKGIRRIWQALQLLQLVGIPVASLTGATVIASANPPAPDVIAANLKNAVKAKYTPDTWRPIAQSVFDKLRQKQRDALVAYLVNQLGLENSNQLFEYFLVDPGMEPVVQTSRLRLAMSSVQTFIQRCMLNLENANSTHPELNVAPSAIDADWWEWMKRYRVWQANREIFLFPENWMEPELRLDKTDLFQALEGALLQGDVTNDLVEDAFFTYLKGLDVRARLDIVTMYLDQDPNNAQNNTLHVLGRTYGHPHKYFYRTYSQGTWSGWIAVTPDIEGNHVTLVIWKGRLNVFWATFISQAKTPQSSGTGPGGSVSSLTFDDLSGAIAGAAAIPQVKVQLHWIEYYQGKWSNRISTDIDRYDPIIVPQDFNPSNVLIHVSKEVDSNGNEGAVRIHLDFAYPDDGVSFRVTSKNCAPDFSESYWEQAQSLPYDLAGADATEYVGSGSLHAVVETEVGTDGTMVGDTEQILKSVNNYGLLPCANPVLPPFVDATAPFFYQDAGSLVAPFFYKDTSNPNASSSNFSDELTFFVQPSLTETTIDEWGWWAVGPPMPAYNWADDTVFNNINVKAQVPAAGPTPVNPGDPVYSIYKMQNTTDWVTNPSTAVSYGGVLICKSGGINTGNLSLPGLQAGVLTAASGITAGLAGGRVATNLTVVGRQGLNLNQAKATATTPLSVVIAGANFNRRTS